MEATVTVTALGAIIGMAVAIILILKKTQPTYAMIAGALAGGIVGGAGLTNTVNYMVTGTQGMASSLTRIIAAGVLAGTLIESGAAEKIAEVIVQKLGEKRGLVAIMIATWLLTAVGVFGDVSCLTVAPIALAVAKKAHYRSMGVMMALVGAVRAGNCMSPNSMVIAAADSFGLPLTSVMAVGIPPAIAGLITTGILSHMLAHKGVELKDDYEEAGKADACLPTFVAAISGPVVTIVLLVLRPVAGIAIDPLIALPAGGIVGALVMGQGKKIGSFMASGIAKMSGVVLLLIGTGCLAGIISNSELKDVIISGMETLGLPTLLLAPISGILMGAATASSTAGTTLACQIFGPTVVASGVSPLAVAGMTHAGTYVFDGLPHGSFFHVSAGSIGMTIQERLKILGYEAINGLAMVATSTILFGVLRLVG